MNATQEILADRVRDNPHVASVAFGGETAAMKDLRGLTERFEALALDWDRHLYWRYSQDFTDARPPKTFEEWRAEKDEERRLKRAAEAGK